MLISRRPNSPVSSQCSVVSRCDSWCGSFKFSLPRSHLLCLVTTAEDAPVGTVVALLNVIDWDAGENGQVSCELSGEAPLSLVASSSGGSYKVVTASALDQEQAADTVV